MPADPPLMREIGAVKTLVLMQGVLAVEASVTLRENGQIDDWELQHHINPYDTFALEEALQLKDQFGGEVIVVSVGRAESETTLRRALALGADRITLILSSSQDAVVISRLLAKRIQDEDDFDLILSGWISAADNKAEIPGRLSELLRIPLVNLVTKFEVLDTTVFCRREDDEVLEWIEVPLPAMIAVDKNINEPRFPTVRNILLANQTPIEVIATVDDDRQSMCSYVYQISLRKRKGIVLAGGTPDQAASFLLTHLLGERVSKDTQL